MGKLFRKGWLLFSLFVLVFSVNGKEDSSYAGFDSNAKGKLKETLLVADELEHSGQFVEAYKKYTEVGKMASAVGNFDYASEIYIKAITLREKYDLKIPYAYPDRNLAYLNLCNHLRQNLNDKSVFWHQVGIHQCEADADTLTMLKLYKSFALHYINKYDHENAIAVNEKALPISLAFGDTVEYAKNLLDYSDLLNKEGRFKSADSIADIGYELIHKYELSNNIKHSTKWSFWFIQLKAFIYLNEGDLDKSEGFFIACLDSINQFNSRGGIDHQDLEYVTNIRLGKLYYELGNYIAADKLFVAAEEILNNPKTLGLTKLFFTIICYKPTKRLGYLKKHSKLLKNIAITLII